MSFVSRQIVPGLVHLDFDSLVEMSKSLIRPQEFAESPKFGNTVFTTSRLKKYMKNYRNPTKDRRASPYTSFVGLNIPGDKVDEFYAKFPAITSAERNIQSHLKGLGLSRYYLIASADKAVKKDSWKAGDHEISHGLWYLSEDYKEAQRKTLSVLPEKYYKEVYNRLLSWGIYGPDVIEDEVHAYLTTDSLSKLKQRFRWTPMPEEVVECHNQLSETLNKFLGRN